MDLERALISKIIYEQETLAKALDENLQIQLLEGISVEIWKWCLDHYRKFNFAPGEQAFNQAFPNYDLIRPTETVSYYISELRSKYAYNRAMEAMKEAAKVLKKDSDPLDAIEYLRKAVRDVDDLTQSSADVDWTSTSEERLLAYESLKQFKGIDGIPSPFPTLNMVTRGFHEEELIFVVARQGVGKTWMLVLMAHFNWLNGHKPLLFSKEMSATQITRRLDATHSKLPYQDLRSGKLSMDHELRWKNDIGNLNNSHPFIVIGEESGGVSHVAAKIERYKPDIVYIDGMYLMDDERGGDSSWLRITHVARDLKKLAKRSKIPIVVTMQFNRDASPSKGDVSNIAYADVAKDADIIIGMFQTEDQRLANMLQIRLLKQREGERCELDLEWDLLNMRFNEIGQANAGSEELDDNPVQF